jgi:hypothetical protein
MVAAGSGRRASRACGRTARPRQGVSRAPRQTQLVCAPKDLRERELGRLKRGTCRRRKGKARIRKAQDAVLMADLIGQISRRDRDLLARDLFAIVSAKLDREPKLVLAGGLVECYSRGKGLDDQRVGDTSAYDGSAQRPPTQAQATNRFESHRGRRVWRCCWCRKPSFYARRLKSIEAPCEATLFIRQVTDATLAALRNCPNYTAYSSILKSET